MIHQLRVYEIFEHNKQAFHDRFRDHAMRIMRSYGFQFVALWETKVASRTEFVYLLEWPDEETMRSAWHQFMNDQEWKDTKERTSAEHGSMVGDVEERVLIPTGY
jgi:heme-degrading monooxygenase HmoA